MKESNKYRILTLIRYLGDGFFYPFFALYLASVKITESKIGLLLALIPLIAIATNPVYTRICKNPAITKKVLGIISISEGLLIAIIPMITNFYLILIVTILIAIFGVCHYSLMDSLLSLYADAENINYSSIRIFGSIAYIIAMLCGGVVAKYLGFNIAFSISCLMFIGAGIEYFLLRDVALEEEDSSPSTKINYKVLFKNKTLIIFLVFYCLVMGVNKTTDDFFALYLESRGVSYSQYGFIFAYVVLIEVIVLFILNKNSKKFNNNILLLISSVCLSLRLLVNFLDLPIIVVAIAFGLRGVGYAIMLHISFVYIVKIVGRRYATSATMLLYLVTFIYTAAFDEINGLLIEYSGYKTFYLVNICISIVAIVIATIRLSKIRKRVLE